MAPPKTRYLICYDITCDRRRTRLAHELEDHGKRVQFSVFECDLNDAAFMRVRKSIIQIIDQETDTVRLYALCQRCLRGVDVLGTGTMAGQQSLAVI